jgi:hypothetical protein
LFSRFVIRLVVGRRSVICECSVRFARSAFVGARLRATVELFAMDGAWLPASRLLHSVFRFQSCAKRTLRIPVTVR